VEPHAGIEPTTFSLPGGSVCTDSSQRDLTHGSAQRFEETCIRATEWVSADARGLQWNWRA
jgi:hypothetical protein